MALIKYNGETLAEIKAGQSITLHTDGHELEGDLVIEGFNGGGSSNCDGCIIEVDTLPTEGIDETALYKMGDTYYKYSDAFKDIIIVQSGVAQSLVGAYTQFGLALELYYVKTRPTENIKVTSAETEMYLYYVEDEDDVLLYVSGELTGSDTTDWMSITTLMGMTNGGAITNISQATGNDTMYALVDNGWKAYASPSGSKTITENGKGINVAQFATVDVEVPDSPLPIEVSTESQMNSLLNTAEVGSVYKYTGTSGTYENGALYVVEESE